MTSSKVPFKWTDDCSQAFQRLKTFLSTHPVLRLPNFDQPFHLQVDASGVGVGAVLLQPDPDNSILHPVATLPTASGAGKQQLCAPHWSAVVHMRGSVGAPVQAWSDAAGSWVWST